MTPGEDVFQNMDKGTLWKKYCGFLGLSMEEFMAIQDQLLMEQISLVSNSPLAKKIIGEHKPDSIEEFRDIVPVTTYQDYLPYLQEQREDVLAEKPFCWVNTSGVEGDLKWVPYTSRGYQKLIDSMVSALILSSARKEGEVRIKKGARIMFHLPSRPFLGGHLTFGLNQRLACHAFPPIEIIDRVSFAERVGKEMDLIEENGLDFIFSLPENLVKIGAKFTEQLNSDQARLFPTFSGRKLKFTLVKLITRILDKPILPHNLFTSRGIICLGAGSYLHRREIEHFWGKNPYDVYLAAETGCLALSGWTGNELNFTPFSGFLEFIPEEEWDGVGRLKSPYPTTRLINELEAGRRYEIVVTNFYGMPFLRYRPGDIIKVVSPINRKAGDVPPQLLYESRVTDIIDLGNGLEISEKKVWQALQNSGLKYEDWFLVEEGPEGENALHLYIELKNSLGPEMEKLLFESKLPLEINTDSLEYIPDIPLKMTMLPRGTFQSYKENKEATGFDLASYKAVHINPDEKFIRELISRNRAGQA